MTLSPQKQNLIKFLFIPLYIFLVFILGYQWISSRTPVAYWDEMLWVGRSYFFQYYLQGDFHNPVWQNYESYDQPKLAEYSYGLWLYPMYLAQKLGPQKPSSYLQFLVQHNLYSVSPELKKYAPPVLHPVVFDKKDIGFAADYMARHGAESVKAINLIYMSRVLDVVLLAGSVVIVYLLVLQYFHHWVATLFALLYGFNPLLITTGVIAQSEALFLFTFNCAFLFLTLYFQKGQRKLDLVLFALFAGLCASTKLNGFMLPIIFLVINTIQALKTKANRSTIIATGFFPLLAAFVILVCLNPFTFSDPLSNAIFLFQWRFSEATVAPMLQNPGVRIWAVLNHFYLLPQVYTYSGIFSFENFSNSLYFRIYLIGSVTAGIGYWSRKAFQKETSGVVIMSSFLIILMLMSWYLTLDWPRYYVQLPLFFLVFQFSGLYFGARAVYRYIRLNMI